MWYRVTRHPQVLRGLTVGQRILGFWGVTSYVYLIHEKFDALNIFKIYKVEVENQLNHRIKSVRSNRGGEYYDRLTEFAQHSSTFFLFLREYDIVVNYTMPRTPEQNGVAKLPNCTLINIERSMMSNSTLPEFL